MSWILKLFETYENCQAMIGVIEDENKVPLIPICHTTQKAQITVTIDGAGNFKRAVIIPKANSRTIIPCTEESGGRTSGAAAHPLADKLQYLAADYENYATGKKGYYASYEQGLQKWCDSDFGHPKAAAVLKYLKNGTLLKDLVQNGILMVGADGKLLEKVGKSKGASFLEGKQMDAFVRWEVVVPGELCSNTWEDKTLWESWARYYSSTKMGKNLCYVTGKQLALAEQHSSKIRNDADKAKIISSNDNLNFTYRGRFVNSEQACCVGFEVTQKAHWALRWLMSRQGYRKGDLAIVAWAPSGAMIPDPLADPLGILGDNLAATDVASHGYTAQDLALRLKNKISGYKSELGPANGIVIMGVDSATPGRMAITFYRELSGSAFLERLENWHQSCAWIHDYIYDKENKKYLRFVGAPAPKDIAEVAYGAKADDKIKNKMVERLLPCIIDAQTIPKDIVGSAVRRASNRSGLEEWEWNKALSIGCALFSKLNYKEGYTMSLDKSRKTRDYLYGRLLAIADNLEQWALKESGENRQTNAARLMQRFSDHPFTTWRTIELALAPYKARLGPRSNKLQSVIDAVMSLFVPEEFSNDKALSGEFLLGYHSQREALRLQNTESVVEAPVVAS